MKIVIADDHPLVRSGIRATLARCDEFEVVGEAQDSQEALKLIQQHQPDLLISDVEMPGLPADELTLAARQLLPQLKVLILTVHADEATIRRLMKARISAYMLKDEAPENLLQAVRALKQGAAWFSQSIALKLMNLSNAQDDLPALTAREKEILQEIALGHDNQTIANRLSLAEQTVRNYASSIYEKIGVSSRVEAVVWARDRGMI